MTPEDIEDLFKRTDGVVAVVQQGSGGDDQDDDDDDDDEPSLTADETSYRIARLKDVLLEAQTAWDRGSGDLDRIAEKLGDGSRRCEWLRAAFPPGPCLSQAAAQSSLYPISRQPKQDILVLTKNNYLHILIHLFTCSPVAIANWRIRSPGFLPRHPSYA